MLLDPDPNFQLWILNRGGPIHFWSGPGKLLNIVNGTYFFFFAGVRGPQDEDDEDGGRAHSGKSFKLVPSVPDPFLCLPDPDPWVRGTDPDRQAKIVSKTVLCLLYDFFSLKNDVNVASKSNTLKTYEIIFGCQLEGHWRKEQDPDRESNPDPGVRGTDPRIRIRTKMSQIRNTLYHKKRHFK